MSKEDKKEIKNNKPPQKDKKPKAKFNLYWVYGILAVVFLGLQFIPMGNKAEEIDWGKMKNILEYGEAKKLVLVNKEYAEIYLSAESVTKSEHQKARERVDKFHNSPHYIYRIGSVETFEKRVEDIQKNVSDPIYIQNKTVKSWFDSYSWLFTLLFIVAIWFIFMRLMSRGAGGGGAGQIFNIGRSKAKLIDKDTKITTNFDDVAGLEGAKMEVMEIVDFLKHPDKYTKLGGKIPKGALLIGPPGTGKTLLAKAVAGEAQVPFFSLSGSDFVEMFVGVGASRVRDLFKQAKEKAPCIIFIDEIDAIGRARGKNMMTGANDERENTLNQLLSEMDGFDTNTGVIILAATNRADILDRALTRAGRFDRQIHVELPNLHERKEIFEVHLRPIKIDDSVKISFLAKQTPGFSGADIANMCNEAALIAARKKKEVVQKQDFLDAVDRIVGGLEKRSKIISPKEKKIIAFHEAGHASVSWLLEHASPLVKVTIVPRGKSLGAAWYLPEERQITTFAQMFDEITTALAGRASEKVNFNEISTGALNDLEKVTKQAFAMVTYFGLNEEIGNISYYDSTGQQEYSFHKPYSDKTAETIDEEVSKLIERAYDKAVKLITDNKEKVEEIADRLLKKEVIFSEDLKDVFGKRQFGEENEDEDNDENKDEAEKKSEEKVEEKTEETKKNKTDKDKEK